MLSAFTAIFLKRSQDKKEEKKEDKVEDKVEKLKMKSDLVEIPRSPLGPRSFVCTFGSEARVLRGACSIKPVPYDVDDDLYDSLFVLDSHSKSIDMLQVQKALGGRIFHGQGSAHSFTKRGGHERRTYCSSDR